MLAKRFKFTIILNLWKRNNNDECIRKGMAKLLCATE